MDVASTLSSFCVYIRASLPCPFLLLAVQKSKKPLYCVFDIDASLTHHRRQAVSTNQSVDLARSSVNACYTHACTPMCQHTHTCNTHTHIHHTHTWITPILTHAHSYHMTSQAVVLEGKYWKRKLPAVATEYRKWRLFYKEKSVSQSSPILEHLHITIEAIPSPIFPILTQILFTDLLNTYLVRREELMYILLGVWFLTCSQFCVFIYFFYFSLLVNMMSTEIEEA